MEWCDSIWNSLRSIWTSTETDHRIPFSPFFFILQREKNHDFYIYSKILKECKDIDQSNAILVFTKGRQWFPIYWSVIPSIFLGIWVLQKQHCGYQRSQNLDYDSRSFGEKKNLSWTKQLRPLEHLKNETNTMSWEVSDLCYEACIPRLPGSSHWWISGANSELGSDNVNSILPSTMNMPWRTLSNQWDTRANVCHVAVTQVSTVLFSESYSAEFSPF